MPSLVEIGKVVLENFDKVFSLFRNNVPLEDKAALHLKKFKFLSHKGALCKVWLNLEEWFRRKRFLI